MSLNPNIINQIQFLEQSYKELLRSDCSLPAFYKGVSSLRKALEAYYLFSAWASFNFKNEFGVLGSIQEVINVNMAPKLLSVLNPLYML